MPYLEGEAQTKNVVKQPFFPESFVLLATKYKWRLSYIEREREGWREHEGK